MRQRMSTLFESYFAVLAEAHALASANNPDSAIKLVGIRRRLADLMMQMSQAAPDIQSALGSSPDKRAYAERYSALLSEERTLIARHQAKWPAVEMSKDTAGYARDMAVLHRSAERDHQWRMTTLLPQLPL